MSRWCTRDSTKRSITTITGVEPHRYFSIQHAPIRPVGSAGSRARQFDPDATAVAEALYVWLFPNVMLNVYMGQMQTNVVLPVAHDRTKVVFEWYAADAPADLANDPRWVRLIEFSHEIQDEDVEICEVCNATCSRASMTGGAIRPPERTECTTFIRCCTSS
jgi:phenylpropionate dioxygenase-like ring-hydroxylating dioxygenase large terminal subunit